MNNRSKAPKKAKRFPFSFSEQEAYALERLILGESKDGDAAFVLRVRTRLTGQLTRHEADEMERGIYNTQEAVQ